MKTNFADTKSFPINVTLRIDPGLSLLNRTEQNDWKACDSSNEKEECSAVITNEIVISGSGRAGGDVEEKRGQKRLEQI